MHADIAAAIDSWEEQWNDALEAAVAALKTAFPPLTDYPRPVSHPILRLEYEEDGLGGCVCVDEGRATITLDHIPNGVIARAVDEVEFPYLDYADGPLAEAPPGTYSYDCEASSSLFEFTLGDLGHGKVDVWGATIPDAVAILDAVNRALEEHGGTPAESDEEPET
ncbi:hypothetical protein [Streptomyces sp. NPDC047981]|uniref:hypothetical protein n=1 Tax=Streptomyces sp. NPDC047981 TaxID=3154610 RepID=UPI003414B168